jgi:hypothetical protein
MIQVTSDMKIDRTGCTRLVILTKNYAFKFPNCIDKGYRWRGLLQGLLANMNECTWWYGTKWNTLCPIIFHLPFGCLNVMPRLQILTDDEYLNNSHIYNRTYYPCEPKSNSYGWLNERIVVIDYGN